MFNILTQIKNISWQLFVVEPRAIVKSTERLLGVQLNDSIGMTRVLRTRAGDCLVVVDQWLEH